MSHAGETFSATSAEYFSLKQQLESECFAPEAPGEAPRYYSQLPQEQRARLLRERLKKYCQRVGAPRNDRPTMPLHHTAALLPYTTIDGSTRANHVMLRRLIFVHDRMTQASPMCDHAGV